MNETEKQIVAWLRKQASLAIQAGPDLDACMKTSVVFTTIADAIERGEHSKREKE